MEFFFHFLPEKNCLYTACTFDMLQSPAGNVRLYPAIKITSNFDIDLIESCFTVFLFYLHKWAKFRDYIEWAWLMLLGRRGWVGPAMTGPFFFDGYNTNLIFSCFYFSDSYFV